MKKGLKRILHIFMTLTLVFVMVIISDDTRIESQKDYNIMLKANINNDEETKEVDKKTETVSENNVKQETKKQEKVKTKAKKVVKKEKVEDPTTNQTAQTNDSTKQNNNIVYGTFGRIYISNYNAALYDYNVNTKSDLSLQTIVDNKDSAAYYKNHGKLVIADHNSQGFKVLVNLSEGTIASIKFENGKTIKYKLINKSEGTNEGYDLVDSNGNSFFDMEFDLIMYTCYNDGIMVTLWALS